MTDLEKAFAAIEGKKRLYNELWQYYDGQQPLRYTSERLRELFRELNARFSENWCSVVVDSVADRIELPRFLVANDQEATAAVNRLWLLSGLNLDSDDAHLAALVCHEAFIVVWPTPSLPSPVSGGEIDAYYNDPRMCHIEYDPDRPSVKLWAAKVWESGTTTDDGKKKVYRMTLYYPDHLEYYQAASARWPEKASVFTPTPIPGLPPSNSEVRAGEGERPIDWPVNPFGVVPMFHLRTNNRTHFGELTQSILELQDANNKLLADMMVAAEYGAFKQRYVISNAEVGNLKNAPNEVWDIPAGDGVGQDTTVGEFGETNLIQYLQAMERLASSIAKISRTPVNYFDKLPSHEVSGEALYALEQPLIAKCRKRIERFTQVWREVAQFLLKLAGYEVDLLDITPLFDDPATVQPRTRAEIRQINNNAGYPLIATLREEGRSESEIAQVLADKRDAQAEQTRSLAQALVEQQRRFDQGAVETGGQVNE